MKSFRLILIPSMALMAIGAVVMFLYAPLEIHYTEEITLAPGIASSGHLIVDTEGGGSITGTYATASGRPVLVMILNDGQYSDFLAGEPYGTELSETAALGTYSIDEPALERLHIVIQHAVEPEVQELVTLDHTVHSMNWEVVFLSTALAFGPAFLLGAVMIKHSRDRQAARGPISSYSDVVLFDNDRKE